MWRVPYAIAWTVARYRRASCFSLASRVRPQTIPLDKGSARGDLSHCKVYGLKLWRIISTRNQGHKLECNAYLFPWKSGRMCKSFVKAERKGGFFSCAIDSNILFRRENTVVPMKSDKSIQNIIQDTNSRRTDSDYTRRMGKINHTLRSSTICKVRRSYMVLNYIIQECPCSTLPTLRKPVVRHHRWKHKGSECIVDSL